MLLPPLCTQAEYVRLAAEAGLRVLRGPIDISRDVSKTWYVLTIYKKKKNSYACALRDDYVVVVVAGC